MVVVESNHMLPYNAELVTACINFQLDVDLVTAQIMIESNGNPWALNPEPLYRYFWDVKTNTPFRHIDATEIAFKRPPKDFPTLAGDSDQEWWCQQCSWGLMQVMGAVAREQGFSAPYLTQLCDPAVNLGIGCRHLAKLIKWAKGNIEQALAAYNGGKSGNAVHPFRNRSYALKVLAAYKKLKDVNDTSIHS